MDRRLMECMQQLQSHLVSARKKSVTELQDVLQHKEIINFLNEASNHSDSQLSWDAVFVATHNALIKEIEKLTADNTKAKSRTNSEQSKNIFTGALISAVVEKATASEVCYLECSKIIDASIYILKKNPHKMLVGHIYERILRDHVLVNENYWYQIKMEQWEDLFDLAKSLLNEHPPRCSKSSIVQLINLIVLHGCEQASFIRILKREKIFILLEELVHKAVCDKNIEFQFNTLSLLVTVCEKLQKECRMAICKFGEEILQKLLNLYESRGESGCKKNQKMFDFLLILMKAHHPFGLSENSEKAYAYNWNNWKSSLKQLNYITIKEIVSYSKKGSQMPENFLRLVVEIYNQIFRMNINSVDVTFNYSLNETSFSSDVSKLKKRRITCGFPDILEQLNLIVKPIDMWPWLAVLSALISKYPDLLLPSDYMLMLQTTSKFLSASKEPIVTDYLCRSCIALLDVHSRLSDENLKADEEVLWDTIWNIVLRTIGLNQNVELSHALLRRMMKYKWKPTMGNAVWNLYLSHGVRFSEHSLLTLYELREQIAFPVSNFDVPVHTSLLRWLIPTVDTISSAHFLSGIPLDVYAHVTVLCCIKNNLKKTYCSPKPLNIDCDLCVNDLLPVSLVYSLNSYDSDVLLKYKILENSYVTENESQSFTLNVEAFEQLSNFIDENCELLLEKCRFCDDKLLSLYNAGSYFMFLVHVLKFKNHYMFDCEVVGLKKKLQSLLEMVTLLMNDLLTPELQEKKLLKCLKYLTDIFAQLGIVPVNIAHEVLINIFPHLEFIFRLFESGVPKTTRDDEMENEEPASYTMSRSLFSSEILSLYDQIRFEACKTLLHYSYHHDEVCQVQKNILKAVLDVLEDTDENQRSTCFLQMAVCACFTAFKINNLDTSLFESITAIMRAICETKIWSLREESAVVILKLIQRGLHAASGNHTDGWDRMKIFLTGMCALLEETGTRSIVQIIHCLGFFTNVKMAEQCFTIVDAEEQQSYLICENIFPYLKDPSHEIRIVAVSFLTRVFGAVDHFASHLELKVDYNSVVAKFTNTLRQCFTVEDSLSEDFDETVNRPLTVLYALACAICSCTVARREMIFHFFDIIYEKRVKQDLGRKILQIVKNHFKLVNMLDLINDNFSFVCWLWFKKYSSFENFPFEVVDCATIKEFYQLFSKDIIIVLLYYGEIPGINSVASCLESSASELLVNCFAEIMSLVLLKLTANSDASDAGMKAEKLHEFVQNTIGNDTIEEKMVARLPDVLVAILRHLHDPQFEIPTCGILPNPVSFIADKNLIEETITYLKSSAGVDTPSLVVYVAQCYPRFIQKIFQKLYIDVIKSSTSEIKLAAFQRYILFCQMLLPYYQDLIQNQMDIFITRTVLCNVLSFVSNDANCVALSLSALKFLKAFMQQWTSIDDEKEKSVSVFKKYLSCIVDKLVPLASRKDDLGNSSLDVLRCLLIDQNESLFDSIMKLDQLPELPEFDQFRTSFVQIQETQMFESSLMSDIEQFLNAENFSPRSPCRVETLKFLRKQLSRLKADLFQMFGDIVNKSLFSEDCLESIPHRLILALIRSIDLRDEKTSYEAICCLGEIGLINLHTMVLQPNHNIADPNVDAGTMIIQQLCQHLTEYIVDENVDVVNASCQILKLVLLCESGYNFVQDHLEKFEKLQIYPFIPSSLDDIDRTLLQQYFRPQKFKENVDNELLWLPMHDISHDAWITSIVCAILDSFSTRCYLNATQSVCRLKVSLAEKIFKYLVYLLLKTDFEDSKKILGVRMNQFFENSFYANCTNVHDSYLSSHSSSGKSIAIFSNKFSVQCLLDVVHFIRLQQSEPNVNDLEINYLYVAKAAQFCSAFFTSILYAELWLNSLIAGSDVEYDGNVGSFLEELYEKSSINSNELLNILRRAFSNVGDSDALFGCGSSILIHPETRIEHYRQSENWSRVMESCDLLLSIKDANSYAKINDLASAIGFCGFNYLQNHYLSSLNQRNPALNDEFYDSGWKLANWNLEEPMDDCKTFSYCRYAALKDIHQGNRNGARLNVVNARRCIIPSFASTAFESTKNLYHVLNKLQCLQDIDDFVTADDLQMVIENWKKRDNLGTNLSFSHKQTILNQRIRMIDSSTVEGKQFVLSVAKQARKEGDFNFAESCLASVRNEDNASDLFDLRVRFEEARLLWDRKEQHLARFILKDLQKRVCATDSVFYSTILRTHGEWLSEINIENPDTILNHYFMPASNISLEMDKERKNRLKTYRCVAEFADLQYRELSEYIKSDDFEEQIKSVRESKKQSDALVGQTEDLIKTKKRLANQSKIEGLQVKEIQKRENLYLVLAMRYYLKMLVESAEEDLKIFRVVSFWLHNKTHLELHREIRETMFEIPTYKFVPVLPQLMAHISPNVVECFGHSLNKLIEKCITDHPHHTLPLILSLANYVKGDQFEKQKHSTKKVENEDRVQAAINYVDRFRFHESIAKTVIEMEKLSDALIQFAYLKLRRNLHAGEVVPIPSQCAVMKINNLENIVCPTVTMPVNKNAVYDDVIGIRRIERNFVAANGINAPKKISCLCTDGKIRHQLVKGQDDMRVDAVMQQVFTIMNRLLSANKRTSQRKLLIRTYKVVPLSRRSGVLEWCTNTISLGEYLVYRPANAGAHHRFRPQDIRTDQARKRIDAARNFSEKDKMNAFQNVCKCIKPVFRYFFVEKFPLPTMWFERKLAYTHSVAVTSMVGYILGIGDRHVQNMLIDETTAEIIHIDFGIAFDQGQTLNCPELIPFRLTRDIEDGMGIFSIDGIFRRCCEQTLTVLRGNSDIIRTTIEVFIHDPLYQWTLTPEKKASLQDIAGDCPKRVNEGVEVSITASRALSRIKLKLQGLEGGTATTVEGQVNRLIQQAKDAQNLSKLFCGWQAYL